MYLDMGFDTLNLSCCELKLWELNIQRFCKLRSYGSNFKMVSLIPWIMQTQSQHGLYHSPISSIRLTYSSTRCSCTAMLHTNILQTNILRVRFPGSCLCFGWSHYDIFNIMFYNIVQHTHKKKLVVRRDSRRHDSCVQSLYYGLQGKGSTERSVDFTDTGVTAKRKTHRLVADCCVIMITLILMIMIITVMIITLRITQLIIIDVDNHKCYIIL